MYYLKHTRWLYIIIVVAVMANTAMAKKKRHKKKKATQKTTEVQPTAPDAEFLALLADLKSKDPEKVVFAVQMLGATGNPEATNELISLLKTGPRNDITNMIIETLGALRNEEAIDTLLSYLTHRRSDARVAAIFALESFSSPKTKPALEQKLRDSDPQVRTSAALALGKIGDEKTVEILFLAFDRGVNNAAISIGRLGTAKDAQRLTNYLGKLSISILLPGFKEFIIGKKIDDQSKVNTLNVLFDFAGPEVRKFAIQMKAQLSATMPTIDKNHPVMNTLNKMIRQIAQD